jgi:hypothetical protein
VYLGRVLRAHLSRLISPYLQNNGDIADVKGLRV